MEKPVRPNTRPLIWFIERSNFNSRHLWSHATHAFIIQQITRWEIIKLLHKSPKTIYSDNNPEISGVIKLWSAHFWCNGSEWYGGQRRFELNYVLRDWRPFGKQSISYFICVRDVLGLVLGVAWWTQCDSSSQLTSLRLPPGPCSCISPPGHTVLTQSSGPYPSHHSSKTNQYRSINSPAFKGDKMSGGFLVRRQEKYFLW